MRSVTVLATSVGNDGFPSVLAALKSTDERAVRVIGTDARQEAAGLALADAGFVVPSRKDPAGLLDLLVSLCAEHQVDVLLPLSTEDQDFFAGHRSVFEGRGIAVATSSAESIAMANDKLALLDACRDRGVRCPAYLSPRSTQELEEAILSLGYPERQVVVKLNRGTGMSGVKIVRGGEETFGELFSRDCAYVRLDPLLETLEREPTFPELHVVEYLPGREFSIDVLASAGRTLASVVRLRLGTLYGLATHAVVVDEPAVDEQARAVVDAIGSSYVVNVQLREDRAGDAQIMEVNPRIPGTVGVSVAAGVNLPYLAVKLALGEDVPAPQQPSIGTEMVRYWSLVPPIV